MRKYHKRILQVWSILIEILLASSKVKRLKYCRDHWSLSNTTFASNSSWWEFDAEDVKNWLLACKNKFWLTMILKKPSNITWSGTSHAKGFNFLLCLNHTPSSQIAGVASRVKSQHGWETVITIIRSQKDTFFYVFFCCCCCCCLEVSSMR